jgi:hypothetical protein
MYPMISDIGKMAASARNFVEIAEIIIADGEISGKITVERVRPS